MIRRLALASTTLLLAFTTFAGKANAQSTDVEFSATIGNTCTIATQEGGLLEVDSGNDKALSTTTPGIVQLNCAGAGTVSVSAPIDNSTDANALLPLASSSSNVYSDAELTTSIADSAGATTLVASNGTDQNLYVAMSVEDQNTIGPGNYAFVVTVTVTPQ